MSGAAKDKLGTDPIIFPAEVHLRIKHDHKAVLLLFALTHNMMRGAELRRLAAAAA